MQTSETRATNGQGRSSPVDDVTYDLLQALTSKLEAIEAYQMYADDGGESAELFERLAAEDREHAEQLLDSLRQRLVR